MSPAVPNPEDPLGIEALCRLSTSSHRNGSVLLARWDMILFEELNDKDDIGNDES